METINCQECGRHTLKQIDNRRIMEIGEQRQNKLLCSGCLIDVNHCICNDPIDY